MNNTNKKVFVYENTVLNTKDVYTIVEEKKNDFIVSTPSKEPKTVSKYEVIFLPNMEEADVTKRIYDYLKDNGIYPTSVDTEMSAYDGTELNVAINIEWGDWKHEHGWCDELMKKMGFTLNNEEVTEEDGSDCYSAIHYYSSTNPFEPLK